MRKSTLTLSSICFCVLLVGAYAEASTAESLFAGVDCTKCMSWGPQCSYLKHRTDFTVAEVSDPKFLGYELKGMCVPSVDAPGCDAPFTDVLQYTFGTVRFLRNDLSLSPNDRFSAVRVRFSNSAEKWDADRWDGISLHPGGRYLILMTGIHRLTLHPSILLACEIHR